MYNGILGLSTMYFIPLQACLLLQVIFFWDITPMLLHSENTAMYPLPSTTLRVSGISSFPSTTGRLPSVNRLAGRYVRLTPRGCRRVGYRYLSSGAMYVSLAQKVAYIFSRTPTSWPHRTSRSPNPQTSDDRSCGPSYSTQYCLNDERDHGFSDFTAMRTFHIEIRNCRTDHCDRTVFHPSSQPL